MDFDQLHATVILAQERNFSKAAYKLFLTQPAISLKIKALEEELGVKLFERMPRDVRLTDAGMLFYDRAVRMLREREQALDDLQNITGLKRGTLRIACSENISRYYLAIPVAKFLKQYPQINLVILNMPSPTTIEAVRKGEADLGFALLSESIADLETRVVLEYKDVGVCSASHPLHARKRVDISELVQHRLLLLNPSTQSHMLLTRDFQKHGASPSQSLELGGADSQKEFARIGLGVGIIPGYTLNRQEKHFSIQGLAVRKIALCKRQGFHSAASEAFTSLLEYSQTKGKGD